MDFSSGVVSFVVAGLILGFFFRNQLRARFLHRRKPVAEPATSIEVILPEPLDLRALTSRLYELDKIFGPFGSNAAHPSDLHAQPDFGEAADSLLCRACRSPPCCGMSRAAVERGAGGA